VLPLHTVHDWVGHTNISQTSTDLESTLTGAHEAMQRFESSAPGRRARANQCKRGRKTGG